MGQLDFQHNPISDGSVRNPYGWTTVGSLSISTACSAVGMLKDHVRRSNLPPLVQPAHGMLKLTVLCVDVMPQFKAVVESIFGTVQGTAMQFWSGTKALCTGWPKRRPAKNPSRWQGVVTARCLLLARICDVVGCLVVCNDIRSMREVVERFKAQAEPDMMVCEVKSRWADSSEGGWRDLICIAPIGPGRIVCEIQMVHAKLQVARKQLDTHKAYAKYRRYFEMLNFAGLLSNSGGGGAGAGAGAGD